MNAKALLFWVGLVGAVILVAAYTGTRARDGAPLDPESTSPLGTHGLVAVLEELGADVRLDVPNPESTRVLLLEDNLNDTRRLALSNWVESGGTLVVTDTSSPFVPDLAPTSETSGSLSSGECSIEGLRNRTLEASSFLFYQREGIADDECFGNTDGAYLHVRSQGAGKVIALGGSLALTNQNLDERDNAVLVAELLLGDPRGDRIAVVYAPFVPEDVRTVSDTIPSGAKWGAWQLIVAVLLFILWRIRRFGNPVIEAQPVELPGSLLVRAVGELRRRSAGYEKASADLRAHVIKRIRTEMKASPELPLPELIAITVAETGLDPVLLQRALAGPPAADGPQIAALVLDIDQIHAALAARTNTPEIPVDARQPVGGTT